MDLKDKKIIYELGLNARITNKALAKKIELSESSTINRIENLIKNKILLGTQPIIDNSKLGYEGYRVYFKFDSTTTDREKEILNWLRNNETVSVLAKCTGSIDVGIMCWVKNRQEFENFINSFKENFKENFSDMEISIYCATHHFSRNYLVENKNREVISIGNKTQEKYDELDLNILKSIFNDARKNILNIAHETKQPATTIAFRLKNLEKDKIIAGYSINLNSELIGYEYYKLNIILNKNISEKELFNFALRHKNIVYLDKTISKYDLELNLEIKNKIELNNIISEIKDNFGGIKEISWFQVDKYLKMEYL